MKQNGIELLLARMMEKLVTLMGKRRFKAAAKGAVVLRIQVDPQADQIDVRDNRFLFQDSRRRHWEEFWETKKPLASMTKQEAHSGMMEFLIKNNVSVERITALESVPLRLLPESPRAMKRSFPPSRIFELFFGSDQVPRSSKKVGKMNDTRP